MKTLSTVFAYALGATACGLMVGLMFCTFVLMYKPMWANV